MFARIDLVPDSYNRQNSAPSIKGPPCNPQKRSRENIHITKLRTIATTQMKCASASYNIN